jgi:hypothetical protein
LEKKLPIWAEWACTKFSSNIGSLVQCWAVFTFLFIGAGSENGPNFFFKILNPRSEKHPDFQNLEKNPVR